MKNWWEEGYEASAQEQSEGSVSHSLLTYFIGETLATQSMYHVKDTEYPDAPITFTITWESAE